MIVIATCGQKTHIDRNKKHMARNISLNLKCNDVDTIPVNAFVLCLGKRMTGKSVFLQSFLGDTVHTSVATHVLITSSPAVRQSWGPYIHPLFHIDIADCLQYLGQLIVTQRRVVAKYGSAIPANRHVVIVMDDCASDRQVMNSRELRTIATAGRHLCISVYITSQYFMQIRPEVRTQFDLVVCLSTSNKNNIDRLHGELASCAPARVFKSVLKAATQNHGLLIIDNSINPVDITDSCFVHRFEYPPRHVRLGSEELWSWADAKYFECDAHPVGEVKDDDDALATNELRDLLGKRSYVFTDSQGDITVKSALDKLKME